jgi:hypothetical protein
MQLLFSHDAIGCSEAMQFGVQIDAFSQFVEENAHGAFRMQFRSVRPVANAQQLLPFRPSLIDGKL